MAALTAPRVRKPILWALGLSVLAHVGAVFGPRLHLPVEVPPPEPIQARLELPPPPKAEPPAPKPRPKPRPKPTAAPQPPPQAAAENGHPQEPEPSAAPPDPPKRTFDPAQHLPRQAQIRYTLYKGGDGFAVGQAEHTLELTGESYTVTSITETSGLASVFVSYKLVQTSQGKITDAGLKPDSFVVQGGRKADANESALFDWDKRQLTLNSGGSRTVALPPGTQDLLSFLYQFAFAPPTGKEVKLVITNGRKIEHYAYDVVGEETLDLPSATVKALHLSKQHRPGEEGTEIWLNLDNHYLPVKIRQLDREGGISGEQIVTSIKTH